MRVKPRNGRGPCPTGAGFFLTVCGAEVSARQGRPPRPKKSPPLAKVIQKFYKVKKKITGREGFFLTGKGFLLTVCGADRSSAVRDMCLTVRVLRGRGAEGGQSARSEQCPG